MIKLQKLAILGFLIIPIGVTHAIFTFISFLDKGYFFEILPIPKIGLTYDILITIGITIPYIYIGLLLLFGLRQENLRLLLLGITGGFIFSLIYLFSYICIFSNIYEVENIGEAIELYFIIMYPIALSKGMAPGFYFSLFWFGNVPPFAILTSASNFGYSGVWFPLASLIIVSFILVFTSPLIISSRGKVSIKRQFEYIGGLIRVRIKISNDSRYTVKNIKVNLKIPISFTFLKVEPDYEIQQRTVIIPELLGQSYKTVGIYLEPIICGKERIHGEVQYTDLQEKVYNIEMSPLDVSVVCPLFFTEEKINMARLNHLKDYKLHKKDQCSYLLIPKFNPKDAHNLVKTLILNHHVKLVQEDVKITPNFQSHSWFFGKTKIKKLDFVIESTINEEDKNIKIQVCCEDEEQLTGLLAELRAEFRKGVMAMRIIDSEKDIKVLRCPNCKGPIDKLPFPGETIECIWCGFHISSA